MSWKNIIALLINDINSYFEDSFFIRINMIFVILFSLFLIIFWPVRENLTFIKPEKLDVGIPLLFLNMVMFTGIMFSLETLTFEKINTWNDWTCKNYLEEKEVFWGKLLSYWFQVVFLMIQVFPVFFFFYFFGIFTFSTILYYYFLGAVISFSFIGMGLVKKYIKIRENTADILLFIFSLIYFAGLFFTSIFIGEEVLINILYHMGWLVFSLILIFVFI
ncbi:MAG: hypothetical protein ACOCQ5_02350 [Halanaerobiales bacterium]